MAERLTSDDGLRSNLTRATLIGFVTESEGLESELGVAMEACKGIRKRQRALKKRIEDAGIDADAFKQARADAEIPGEVREQRARAYAQYMAWMGKPIGTQAVLPLEAGAPQPEVPAEAHPMPANGQDIEEQDAVAENQRNRIINHGRIAGERGDQASTNPWTPGTLGYAIWHDGWQQGQEKLVQSSIGSDSAQAAPPRQRRRRAQPDTPPAAA